MPSINCIRVYGTGIESYAEPCCVSIGYGDQTGHFLGSKRYVTRKLADETREYTPCNYSV